MWRGGGHGEAELLARCYRNSLALAAAHGLRTLAFPAISCGVYGYPWQAATAIAIREVRAPSSRPDTLDTVLFACFSADMLALYARLLAA